MEDLVRTLVSQGYVSIPQKEDYISAIKKVVEQNRETFYVCISPFTNLAEFIRKEPVLATKLNVIIMGGSLNYRDPTKAEHNVRYSISDEKGQDEKPTTNAALEVFKSSIKMRWVLSDTTFKPDLLGVKIGDPVYLMLKSSDSQTARLLLANCDNFFAKSYPCTIMHDPLTLSCIIDPTFLTFEEKLIRMDDNGIMSEIKRRKDSRSKLLRVSSDAKYGEFMSFMRARISKLLENSDTHMLIDLKRDATKRKIKI